MKQVIARGREPIGHGEIEIMAGDLTIRKISQLSQCGIKFAFDSDDNIVIKPKEQAVHFEKSNDGEIITFLFLAKSEDVFFAVFETEMVITRHNCDHSSHVYIAKSIGFVTQDDIIDMYKNSSRQKQEIKDETKRIF